MTEDEYIIPIEFPKAKHEEVWKRIDEMFSGWETYDEIKEQYRKSLLKWDSKK